MIPPSTFKTQDYVNPKTRLKPGIEPPVVHLNLPKYSIVVDYASEGEIANLIRGYVEIQGKRIRFSGVAYGRFGGQNFSPQFSEAAKRNLKSMGVDFEKFEEDVQLRLVRGEFEARPPKDEKHGHIHLGEQGAH